MIVKKVKNPSSGSSKAARISSLIEYIQAPENQHSQEKCVYYGQRNFLFDKEHAIEEMTALAQEAKRSADPVEHFVLSWQEGETPTTEQVEQAVDILLSRFKLTEHQCVYALHADTDNVHLHVVINRVHPDTLKIARINRGFDIEAAHQAVAEIEHIQGWKREENGRYEIGADGELVKAGQSQQQQPDSETRDQEIRTGERSAQRIAIEDAAPIIQRAASWRQLHEELAAAGMRYERQGSGAVIFVGDVAVKASTADRNATIGKLQARLGAYQSATSVNLEVNYERITIPAVPRLLQPNITEIRTLSKHCLCDLSGRCVASDARQKESKGLLQIDVSDSGRATQRVRRADDDRSRSSKGLKNSPDFVRYQSKRVQFSENKRAAWDELKTRHEAEKQQLRERLSAERKEALAGDWKGKGALLNAMKSVIAAQQAAEKLELKERHEAEKKRVREAYPAFPSFEQWLRENVGERAAEEYRHKDAAKENRIYGVPGVGLPHDLPARPLDIRDFTANIQGREVVYQSSDGRESFIDRGKHVAVLDTESEASIRAAMQLASQKFGGTLEVTGTDEFKQMCVRIAVEQGIRLQNPELQDLIKLEISKQKSISIESSRSIEKVSDVKNKGRQLEM